MSTDANDLSLPITRCPHCKTAFRVRETQLTQRRGMVRCGACRGVFNAIQHMLHRQGDTITISAPLEGGVPVGYVQSSAQQSPLTLMQSEVAPASPVSERVDSAPPAASGSAPKVLQPNVSNLHPRPTEDKNAAQPSAHATANAIAAPAAADVATSTKLSDTLSADVNDTPTTIGGASRSRTRRSASSTPKFEPDREISTDELEAELAGVAKPESALERFERSDKQYEWNSDAPPAAPWATVFWGLSVVVLTLALLAHGFYVLRDEVVSRFPAARAPLTQVCARLGCTIKAPARPESILIEGAEFTRDPAHTGLYILNATLRNKHHYPAAYPHLVLTLTGVDGQVQSRRVFPPSEFLGGGANLITGMSGNGEIEFKFWIDASSISPVGFDVRTTHPPQL